MGTNEEHDQIDYFKAKLSELLRDFEYAERVQNKDLMEIIDREVEKTIKDSDQFMKYLVRKYGRSEYSTCI